MRHFETSGVRIQNNPPSVQALLGEWEVVCNLPYIPTTVVVCDESVNTQRC